MAGGRWWLTTDSAEIVIREAPDRLYGIVSDLPRMGEWTAECERVEWTDGSTGPREGATFVGHNRTGPRKMIRWSRRGRVLAAEPGREFAFATQEGGRDSTIWRYRFEAVDGGTRVTESYEVLQVPVWARILDGPLNRHREIQLNMQRTLQQLKSIVEGREAS